MLDASATYFVVIDADSSGASLVNTVHTLSDRQDSGGAARWSIGRRQSLSKPEQQRRLDELHGLQENPHQRPGESDIGGERGLVGHPYRGSIGQH